MEITHILIDKTAFLYSSDGCQREQWDLYSLAHTIHGMTILYDYFSEVNIIKRDRIIFSSKLGVLVLARRLLGLDEFSNLLHTAAEVEVVDAPQQGLNLRELEEILIGKEAKDLEEVVIARKVIVVPAPMRHPLKV